MQIGPLCTLRILRLSCDTGPVCNSEEAELVVIVQESR
jgi:hypothetical protein